MGVDVSVSLVVGERFSHEETFSETTKYNPDTGEPRQVKVKVERHVAADGRVAEDWQLAHHDIGAYMTPHCYDEAEDIIIGFGINDVDLRADVHVAEVDMTEVLTEYNRYKQLTGRVPKVWLVMDAG